MGRESSSESEAQTFNFRKTWERGGGDEGPYKKWDVVIRDGHRYVALRNDPQGDPKISSHWALFSMRGLKGRKGDKGDPPSLGEITKAIQAFMDTQEGVPVRAFRGQWRYQESYSVGDIVVYESALYVAAAANDGMIPPVGTPGQSGNADWQHLFSVSLPQIPKNTVLHIDSADFTPGETLVDKNTQISRNGWLMIANKATSDYPDPQNSGIQSADMPESPTWDVDPEHIGAVRTVHQYTLTQPGFIKGLQVEVPDISPNVDYRFYASVQRPGQDVRSMVFDHPVLVADSWVLLGVDDSPHPTGTVFTVVSQALNSTENTTWEHNWGYSGTSTTATPAAGDWNRRSQQDLVRVSFEAEDGDQQLDLNAVTPGSLIRFSNAANVGQYWEYYVTGVTENTAGSCFEYDVDLNTTGPSGDIPVGATCVITATIPTPLATKYKQIADYWLTGQPDWATVVGAVELDGVAQAGEADNAHGIRLTFQPAYVSPDWNFLAHTT